METDQARGKKCQKGRENNNVAVAENKTVRRRRREEEAKATHCHIRKIIKERETQHICACACACVCVRVRACVRACVSVRVCIIEIVNVLNKSLWFFFEYKKKQGGWKRDAGKNAHVAIGRNTKRRGRGRCTSTFASNNITEPPGERTKNILLQ